MLVSCGTDLQLHNTTTYNQINVYRPADSTGQIQNISWCKDGSWLALIPSRGNAEIIRTKEDVRLLKTIFGVPQPTAAVFQRTTKRSLAMSTVSGSVLLYDIKTNSIKKRFVNSQSSVNMLDWSWGDFHLAAGSTDGQITLYTKTTNQKTAVMTNPESKSVSVVRFHSTLRHILGTASDEGVVVVWDINYVNQKMCLKPHKAPVTDLVFSSRNNELLVSVSLDRTFQCYEINAGIVRLSVMTDHPLSAVDMAADGFTVAVASTRGTIYIYDLRQLAKPLKTIAAHSGEIKKIFYQPQSLDSTIDLLKNAEEKEKQTVDSSNLSYGDNFSSKSNNNNAEELMVHDEEEKIKSNSAAGDSFLNSFDYFHSFKRNTSSFIREKPELSTLGLSGSVNKYFTNSFNKLCNSLQVPIIEDVIASTPRIQNQERVSPVKSEKHGSSIIYPILPMETPALSTQEINKTVHNVVREVVREEISDLSDVLNRFFLNIQLCLSKQIVAQENYIDRLFGSCGRAANLNLTMQMQQLNNENEFLKSKINELMRKNNS